MLLLAVALLPGCKKRRVPAEEVPDAQPSGEILTPGGYVNPQEIKKEVTDTLQKEHERSLEPKVE